VERRPYTYENKPWRGAPMLLSNDDSDERQPVLDYEVKYRVFSTDNPEDLEDYRSLKQLAASGAAVCTQQHVEFQAGGWYIFQVWAEGFYRAPDERDVLLRRDGMDFRGPRPSPERMLDLAPDDIDPVQDCTCHVHICRTEDPQSMLPLLTAVRTVMTGGGKTERYDVKYTGDGTWIVFLVWSEIYHRASYAASNGVN
jgi:hypothetical protein